MASHGSSFQKIFMGAAGNAGGAGLDITDVFSTNLYIGNNSALTVNTGLDQNTEGGMLWVKSRSTGSTNHGIWDTERQNGYYLPVNSTDNGGNIAAASGTNPFLRDNSFRWNAGHGWFNQSGKYVAWAFRKAEKFFDVVTYTGNGASSRAISHNLGSTVGMLVVKRTSGADNWTVFHRGMDATAPEDYTAYLNTTEARANQDLWADTAPTDSVFNVGSNIKVNGNGSTYVAYLFAHNDSGDGGFGPDGDQDIIKCGTYTGNGNNTGPVIDLGFEPQWLLIKNISDADPWLIFDNMRKFNDTDNNTPLIANSSDSESNDWAEAHAIEPTATGFKLVSSIGYVNNNNNNFIYMAIRRGPLAVPEDATEVFAIDAVNSSTPFFTSGFPVDMGFYKSIYQSSWYVSSRITGLTEGEIDTTAAFGSATAAGYDNMTGFLASNPGSNYYGWMWKRAPSYFDSVAFSGNGTAGRTVSHNLGVAPEMMWVKVRSIVEPWVIYHKGMNGGTTPEKYHMRFTSGAEAEDSDIWNNTAPTSSVFTTGGNDKVNANNQTYISYLFATAPGVSKVGSYTGNGASSRNIDCGFTSGSRFVMIKDVDHTAGWFLLDSLRGIVSGDDPFLSLNSTAQQNLDKDVIDPYNGGFTVTLEVNGNGYNYIFYAIA